MTGRREGSSTRTTREDNFRVGGVADQSYGQTLERKNWNAHVRAQLAPSRRQLERGARAVRHAPLLRADELRRGRRSGSPPATRCRPAATSSATSSATATRGKLRDTFHQHFTAGRSLARPQGRRLRISACTSACASTPIRTASSSISPTPQALPLAYAYGVGSSDVTIDTNIYGAFLEDAWRPNTNLAGQPRRPLRPRHERQQPRLHASADSERRARRTRTTIQPRASFSYDVKGDGTNVLRGGAGTLHRPLPPRAGAAASCSRTASPAA